MTPPTTCRECGCTDETPCEVHIAPDKDVPCAWISHEGRETNICTACALQDAGVLTVEEVEDLADREAAALQYLAVSHALGPLPV